MIKRLVGQRDCCFHNCLLQLRDFLTKNRSVPNEIKMCRICMSNVSCGRGEMVGSATGGEFGTSLIRLTLHGC